MRTLLKFSLVICILATTGHIYAKDVDNRQGIWFGTFGNEALNKEFAYWIETQLRYGVEDGKTDQILYRTGVLQKLNQKHSLGYLYGYIQSGDLREHRPTFQHVQKYGKLGRFEFGHRARLEARFLEQNDDDAARARYLVRAAAPGFQRFNYVVWDEVFINLTRDDWTGDRAFDRNRLFFGLSHDFFSKNRVEFGYLNQYIPREEEDVSEHLLVAYLFF